MLDDQEDGFKPIWVFDNQVKSNPISIATFPAPSDKDYLKVGGHFGPHNVHENRPGSFQSSETDLRDLPERRPARLRHQDQFRPKEVAAFVPPPPKKWVDPRPNRPVVLHLADVFVDSNALCYVPISARASTSSNTRAEQNRLLPAFSAKMLFQV